jgi:hypothetical protein
MKPKLRPILPVFSMHRGGLQPIIVRYKLPGAKTFFTVTIGWNR